MNPLQKPRLLLFSLPSEGSLLFLRSLRLFLLPFGNGWKIEVCLLDCWYLGLGRVRTVSFSIFIPLCWGAALCPQVTCFPMTGQINEALCFQAMGHPLRFALERGLCFCRWLGPVELVATSVWFYRGEQGGWVYRAKGQRALCPWSHLSTCKACSAHLSLRFLCNEVKREVILMPLPSLKKYELLSHFLSPVCQGAE